MLPLIERSRVPAVAPGCAAAPPLVLHLVEKLNGDDANGLLELLGQMPPERYRHAVLSLQSGAATLAPAPGVQIIGLEPRPRLPWSRYLQLYRAVRQLRPDLIHTRSPAGAAGQLLAAAAGVRLRLHSGDDGCASTDRSCAWSASPAGWCGVGPRLRRALAQRLAATCGTPTEALRRCSAGIDSLQFHPRLGPPAALGPAGYLRDGVFVVGAAGHMGPQQDYAALVRAFLMLLADEAGPAPRLRLLIAGDGPCRAQCRALLQAGGAEHLAWLPGARADLARLMRAMDVFVQPAPGHDGGRAMLQAMASGLPVVASAAALPQLVQPSWTGTLVPPGQPELLADAIADYVRIPGLAQRHGRRGRHLVLSDYSRAAVAHAWLAVYDALFARPPR